MTGLRRRAYGIRPRRIKTGGIARRWRRPGRLRWLAVLLLPLLTAGAFLLRCRPLVLAFAESEALWIAERTVNTAAETVIDDNAALCRSMIETTYNDQHVLASVVTDAAAVNRMKTAIGSEIMRQMDGLTEVYASMPLGTMLGLDFLSGWGPLISLPMSVTNSVFTTVSSSLEAIGMNQTSYRVLINVEVSLYVVTPGGRTTAKLNTAFSVAEAVLLGDVPEALTEVYGDDQSVLGKIFDYGNAQ